MSDLYADSTVAMSAYNALALTGGSTLDKLHSYLEVAAHPELDLEQSRRAAAELVERGLAVKAPVNSPDGATMLYRLVDAKRRLVVGRDRSDMVEDDDGRWSGGWERWMAREVSGALVSVEEVIK